MENARVFLTIRSDFGVFTVIFWHAGLTTEDHIEACRLSRSRFFLKSKSQKQCMLKMKLLCDTNMKPWAGYQMVPVSMTVNDPNRSQRFFKVKYVKNGAIYSVSRKNPPCGFLTFFPKRLGIFSQFFAHLLHVTIYARRQIFIQLSPTLTKLCHTKRDHPSIFLHFTRT